MLLLFQSTHDVILAEKAIRQQGIPRRVIPVPRSVSSQCGMALEIDPADREKVVELLESSVFPSGSVNGNVLNKRYQIYTLMDEE
jgi:hypothetical protein